jgi:hypothetical protein
MSNNGDNLRPGDIQINELTVVKFVRNNNADRIMQTANSKLSGYSNQ